jgi:hypothetical protein
MSTITAKSLVEARVVAAVPGIAVQFGNDTAFQRPESAPWIRVTIPGGDEKQMNLGGSIRHGVGAALVDVYAAVGAGEDEALRLALTIAAAFDLQAEGSMATAEVTYGARGVANGNESMGIDGGRHRHRLTIPFSWQRTA